LRNKLLLKYPYLYVICSVENRIMDFGLAHLNWPSTLLSAQMWITQSYLQIHHICLSFV